jgi:hypothetical protein
MIESTRLSHLKTVCYLPMKSPPLLEKRSVRVVDRRAVEMANASEASSYMLPSSKRIKWNPSCHVESLHSLRSLTYSQINILPGMIASIPQKLKFRPTTLSWRPTIRWPLETTKMWGKLSYWKQLVALGSRWLQWSRQPGIKLKIPSINFVTERKRRYNVDASNSSAGEMIGAWHVALGTGGLDRCTSHVLLPPLFTCYSDWIWSVYHVYGSNPRDGICKREEEKPKEKRGMEIVFSFDVWHLRRSYHGFCDQWKQSYPGRILRIYDVAAAGGWRSDPST